MEHFNIIRCELDYFFYYCIFKINLLNLSVHHLEMVVTKVTFKPELAKEYSSQLLSVTLQKHICAFIIVCCIYITQIL